MRSRTCKIVKAGVRDKGVYQKTGKSLFKQTKSLTQNTQPDTAASTSFNLPDLTFNFIRPSEPVYAEVSSNPFNSTEIESNVPDESKAVIVMEKCIYSMLKKHKIFIQKKDLQSLR